MNFVRIIDIESAGGHIAFRYFDGITVKAKGMNIFNLFNRKGSELETLQKDYDKLLKQAMSAQRNGDIKSYSEITSRAEAIGLRLDKLRAE